MFGWYHEKFWQLLKLDSLNFLTIALSYIFVSSFGFPVRRNTSIYLYIAYFSMIFFTILYLLIAFIPILCNVLFFSFKFTAIFLGSIDVFFPITKSLISFCEIRRTTPIIRLKLTYLKILYKRNCELIDIEKNLKESITNVYFLLTCKNQCIFFLVFFCFCWMFISTIIEELLNSVLLL